MLFIPLEYIIHFDKTIQNTKGAEREAGDFSLQEDICISVCKQAPSWSLEALILLKTNSMVIW